MISFALFKKEMKSNWKFLLILIIVLCFYATVIVTMFDPKLASLLDGFSKSMPELMSAFGMQNPGTDLTSFLVSYFYGFFALLFPLIFIIAMSSRLLSKYIDNGSMSYLLATPCSRKKILFTQFCFLLFCLFVMILAVCTLGIVLSSILFPKQLDVEKFILVNANVMAIQFCVGAICFFISTIIKDARQSFVLAIAIPVGLYIFQMLGNLGGSMDFFKYFTIYTLYNPNGILAASSSAYMGVLASLVLGIGLYMASLYVFNKRDLNV